MSEGIGRGPTTSKKTANRIRNANEKMMSPARQGVNHDVFKTHIGNPKNSRSLVAEGFYRIKSSRLVRRPDPEEQTNTYRDEDA